MRAEAVRWGILGTATIARGTDPVVESPTVDAHSFTAALRHIAAALREEAPPQHLASPSALPVAGALGLAREAAGLPLVSSPGAGGGR